MYARWLVLMLCPCILMACDPKGQHKEPGRHHEPQGGYSLIPPDGWQTADMPGCKYKLFIGPAIDDSSPNFNVVDEHFTGSLDDYVQLSAETLKRLGMKVKKDSQEELQLASGVRAVKLSLENSMIGTPLEQTVYLFGGPERKFVVTCSKRADDERDWTDAVDASVRSFRFDNK